VPILWQAVHPEESAQHARPHPSQEIRTVEKREQPILAGFNECSKFNLYNSDSSSDVPFCGAFNFAKQYVLYTQQLGYDFQFLNIFIMIQCVDL